MQAAASLLALKSDLIQLDIETACIKLVDKKY